MERETTYFKKFETEIISKDTDHKWTEHAILDQKPSWKDFADERVAVSYHHLNQIKNNLEQKHFCILIGGKDVGKTWLSYALSYDLIINGKNVRLTNIDENFSAEEAWNEINKKDMRGEGKTEVYFIIEDCHLNCSESEKFFQKILILKEKNYRFLFNMRKIGIFLLEDVDSIDLFYIEGKKRECIVNLIPDEMNKEHVKNIINKYLKVKNIKYAVTEKELEETAKKWGNDLFWVRLRLDSWEYDKNKELINITDDQVYNFIWSDRYEIKLAQKNRQNILLPLAAVCQFESLKVIDSFLRGMGSDEKTLKELKDNGIILISGQGYEFLNISESFADVILMTILKKDPYFKNNFNSIEEYTIKILKNFLIQNPRVLYVFSAIFSEKETRKANFSRQILSSLINDEYVWNELKENVSDISLGHFNSLIDSILWATGDKIKTNKQASEIVVLYLKHNYKKWQDKLKSSSTSIIRDYLRLLSRFINIENFFNEFTISDFIKIINNSTINSIKRIIFELSDKKTNDYDYGFYQFAPATARKMTMALYESNIALLISKENASIYGLGGLIGTVVMVNPSAAEKFVEKLSEIDLNEIFSRDDPFSVKKGFPKIKAINFFLSRWISFTPIYRMKIINNINDDVWYDLIKSTSFDHCFWLVWNIYVNNPIKAKHIIQNGVGKFLVQTFMKDEKDPFFLPTLGILHLCDFNISNISIKAHIQEIEKILITFKKEKKPTHLVLSLLILNVKLSSQEFENLQGVLDKQCITFIKKNPDYQLRNVLLDLIR